MAAQQEAVITFVARKAGVLMATYSEVESGRLRTRPQLQKAIAHCKDTKATLIVAKLDRLARDVAFVFALRDTGVDFVCADMPDFNTLSLAIFAAMAQYERELISQRIKAALQAKKAADAKLGNPSYNTKRGAPRRPPKKQACPGLPT